MIKELCFKLKPFQKNLEQDYIIDSFITFAIENGISIGGNLENGFCFCCEKKFSEMKIKSEFLRYLRISHSGEFEKITYQKFDELKGDLDEILI